MKIALVDISILGHRASYFRYFSKTLVEAGNEVYIFCPDTIELKKSIDSSVIEYVHFTEFALPKSKTFFFNKCESGVNVIRNWVHASDCIKQKAPDTDLVFFMGLDHFIPTFSSVTYFRIKAYKILNRLIPLIIDSVFPYKWSGINLRLDLEVEHVHKAKNNVAVGLLDEYFVFRQQNLDNKKIAFPDIANVESTIIKSELEKKILTKANGRKIISILGSIDKRKSVITFLDIAQLCQRKNYFFVIAGRPIYESFDKFDEDRIKALNNDVENCFFHLEKIDDGPDFNALIRLSDIIFASYLEFLNSSNILTKTAYFKKPVIVSKKGCMAKRIEKYNIGVTMEEGIVSDGINMIDRVLQGFDYKNAAFDNYFDAHSEPELKRVLVNLIEKTKIK